MNKTFFLKNSPKIIGSSSICGPKESQGFIGKYVKTKLNNDTYGEDSFEKAESRMLFTVIKNAIIDSKLEQSDINATLSGDLLNQIIASTFAARNFDISYLGLYNACATFAEALLIGSVMIDGDYLKNVVCATSSHFSSAERQYRYPLELGSTRPPQAQWTVTGAGALVLSKNGVGPKITCCTMGKIVDFGVTDANNMGAAMAPAAANTIVNHFKDSGFEPCDYDLIITGDLGALGSRILKDLLFEKGYDIEKQHVDCGELVYNICEKEYQGGSGAGCSSLVFCSYILNELNAKRLNKVLLVATGALLSSVSSQQGESIPSIAHAIRVEN